jgi:predicted transcriptional regulator
MNVPDALNHPTRRRILRVLADAEGARSASEILAAGAADQNLSVVRYHLRVLEGAGIIGRLEAAAADDEPAYSLLAAAAEDPQVIGLLESTPDADFADGG